MSHNCQKFATDLSAKLATRSRHVCMFFGAGVAKVCGLPDVVGLQKKVLADLEEPHKALFAKQLNKRNLEQALSRIRRIAALLKDSDVTGTVKTDDAKGTKPTVETKETIDGLTATAADKLDEFVCQAIVKELDLSTADLKPMLD